MSPPCAPLGAFGDLALHAFALIPPTAGMGRVHLAASLHDHGYATWALATLPAAATDPVRRDAVALGALFARASAEDIALLSTLPALYRDIDRFLGAARRELAELGEDEVDDPRALRALVSVPRPLAELLRCALLLAAPAYAKAHRDLVRPEVERSTAAVLVWLERAAEAAPGLRSCPVALAHPLGARGRATADAVWIGAPARWNDLSPARAAVQALHEAAVRIAGGRAMERAVPDDAEVADAPAGRAERDWALVEACALAAVAELARGTALEAAHAEWLARLDVRGLPCVQPET